LSDVYSLGAILYCLLTARPPFAAETVHETLLQVVESEPVPPRLLNRSVPRDLEAICLKCLEKSATRRYPTAQKLVEDLQRFQNGEPVEASKDSAGSRIMRLLLQETRHPEILRQSCHIWMWHSVQLFLLGLLTNVLIWQRVRETWPYVVLWTLVDAIPARATSDGHRTKDERHLVDVRNRLLPDRGDQPTHGPKTDSASALHCCGICSRLRLYGFAVGW
jgi:hypothetical protein